MPGKGCLELASAVQSERQERQKYPLSNMPTTCHKRRQLAHQRQVPCGQVRRLSGSNQLYIVESQASICIAPINAAIMRCNFLCE